jgi:hypothetical protein
VSIDVRLNNQGLSYQLYPTDGDLARRIDGMPDYDQASKNELKGFSFWVRAMIDYLNRDALLETDFDSLQYIQARVTIFREFQFVPKEFTASDCGILKTYKLAIEAKRTQLNDDKTNGVISDRWFNIYRNVVNDLSTHLNGKYSTLACDVVLPQQQQQQQAQIIQEQTTEAIKNQDGSGIDYITIAVVTIVIIVMIVIIKKLRNG